MNEPCKGSTSPGVLYNPYGVGLSDVSRAPGWRFAVAPLRLPWAMLLIPFGENAAELRWGCCRPDAKEPLPNQDVGIPESNHRKRYFLSPYPRVSRSKVPKERLPEYSRRSIPTACNGRGTERRLPPRLVRESLLAPAFAGIPSRGPWCPSGVC